MQGGPQQAWPMQEPAAQDLAIFRPVIESVTVVNSSEALLAAVKRGDSHIQLRAHLDLTDMALNGASSVLGEIPWAVQSIQVRSSISSEHLYKLFVRCCTACTSHLNDVQCCQSVNHTCSEQASC
jgi:hypothetical protein